MILFTGRRHLVDSKFGRHNQLFVPKMIFLSANNDFWEDLKMDFFKKGPGPTSGKSGL